MTRVGLVSWWFNRGQAVVTRRLRAVLDELGHETSVLARRSPPGFHRPSYVDRTGVWAQAGVTEASSNEIPWEDYERWLEATDPEVVICFQNYGFEEIARMRGRGVRTVGCFMWEFFGPEHVAGAIAAYDVIYALTRSSQRRFTELGVECAYVPWGCHPEDVAARGPARAPDGVVTYFVPGGYVSRRKPVPELIAAFGAVDDPRLRLVLKLQGAHRRGVSIEEIRELARPDQRISVVDGDLPQRPHMALFAASDVCLAPSRWEGLGLHLYEAAALGLPTITTAAPPMDEVVRDGEEGVLVPCTPAEATRSGVLAVEPDPDGLRDAIARLADDDERARQAAIARESAAGRLAWRHTVEGYRELLETALAGR